MCLSCDFHPWNHWAILFLVTLLTVGIDGHAKQISFTTLWRHNGWCKTAFVILQQMLFCISYMNILGSVWCPIDIQKVFKSNQCEFHTALVLTPAIFLLWGSVKEEVYLFFSKSENATVSGRRDIFSSDWQTNCILAWSSTWGFVSARMYINKSDILNTFSNLSNHALGLVTRHKIWNFWSRHLKQKTNKTFSVCDNTCAIQIWSNRTFVFNVNLLLFISCFLSLQSVVDIFPVLLVIYSS